MYLDKINSVITASKNYYSRLVILVGAHSSQALSETAKIHGSSPGYVALSRINLDNHCNSADLVVPQLAIEMEMTKGLRFPIEVVQVCIRWFAASPISYRHIEEMMLERGVVVEHSSITRWSIRFLSILEKEFRQHKRSAGISWRMDETYIEVKSA